MCGIYGTTIKYDESQIKDKLKRTGFRGPDKMGINVLNSENHNIILGHNRLAIIDLDARSNQPFTYYNHLHIVYNGEIYNFKIIKKTLEQKGYHFNTTSDTEVICAAFLEYENECVTHFNGMFSFVIYNSKTQTFFGARDRLGKKPFYYYHNGKDFEFASQISSIQLHHNNLTISSKSISNYLIWGTIPEPNSIFNEIKKLPPGHFFNYNLNTESLKIEEYWNIDYKGENLFKGTYNDAKQELNLLLKDAVSSRLYADVPVGVFLSGGVDSSLVSAIASKMSNTKVKTFSVKFNEDGFDESKYAKQVADYLNTEHHIIECNYNEGLDLIHDFYNYYDEPFSDASAIPSMLLAKYTKQHVTVALSGDGGDESFIGYQRYNWINKGKYLYTIPLPIRLLMAKIMHVSNNYKHKVLAQTLTYKNINDAYLASMSGLDTSWIDLKHDNMIIYENKYLNHNSKSLLERVSDFDIKTYLNWDINTKVDRATMAFSLEARAPLMDHRIVEFSRSLPTHFKYQKHNQKRILKDVLYEHVPKTIFDRPKSGFTMPFADWFRNDLKDFVKSELNEEGLNAIPGINKKEVTKRIQQHMDGTWNRYPLIWRLLVLKQWLNTNGKTLHIN
jgi:asparagine synthase (glutamine-hydrolysing)